MFMLLLRSSLFFFFLSLATSFQEQVTSLETDETEVGAFSHCFQLTKRAEIPRYAPHRSGLKFIPRVYRDASVFKLRLQNEKKKQ